MKYAFFAVLCTASFLVAAAEHDDTQKSSKVSSKSGFYEKTKQGWYWFEEDQDKEKAKEEIIPPIIVVPPPQQSKESSANESATKIVVINAQWLRENLPELKENAINEPTDDNLKAYFYAQRMTADMASRFAMRTVEFFANNPELDENNRSPTSAFVLNEHKSTSDKNKASTLKQIFKETGLWMFVKSDCSFCKSQLPVIEELKRLYNVDVLFISVDGAPIYGHTDDNYVFDVSGEARKRLGFNVSLTPTLVLVRNDKKDAVVLSEGMKVLTVLEDRVLAIAKNSNWINNEEFLSTQRVRNITTLDETNNVSISVPIESDAKTQSQILVEKLKTKLTNAPRISASKIQVKGNANE